MISLPKLPQRFWDKVEKTDSCWLWTAGIQSDGYGTFRYKGKTCLAHRVSYEVHNKGIDQALVVDHICRVRACVNPVHLRLVTWRTNAVENSVGACAKHAAKTHCKNSHPLSGDNLILEKQNGGARVGRRCRICNSARAKRIRERKSPEQKLAKSRRDKARHKQKYSIEERREINRALYLRRKQKKLNKATEKANASSN